MLLDIGVPLVPYKCPITLADHKDQDVEALVGSVEIELDGVICQQDLVVIPAFTNTPILVRIDFLEEIGMFGPPFKGMVGPW